MADTCHISKHQIITASQTDVQCAGMSPEGTSAPAEGLSDSVGRSGGFISAVDDDADTIALPEARWDYTAAKYSLLL